LLKNLRLIKIFILISAVFLTLTTCSVKSENLERIFFDYYYLGSQICIFEGSVTYDYADPKFVQDKFHITYIDTKGGVISRQSNSKNTTRYILNDNKISVTSANGRKTIYEDTEINRLKAGLPVNLGIDPYYFLETDLNDSSIIKKSDNTLSIIYNNGNNIVQADVLFKDRKILSIETYFNSKSIYQIEFDDYIKLENGLFFPKKYTQTFTGDNLKTIICEYDIDKIKLCN